MTERNLFIAHETEPFVAPSAHFGVSIDNFISSLPQVGMEAVNIAQGGFAIGLTERQYITSKILFHGAYEVRSSSAGNETRKATGTYRIPDEVCEFAQSRNIDPIVITRVGASLLNLVASYNVALESKMPVRKYKTKPSEGKLDSFLKLSISPLNMVIPTSVKPTITEKLFKS